MQNFNKQVAGLAIELFNNCEVYNIAKAHFEGKAEFKEQALPSLKAVKKYLKQTGLLNGYTPINEA